MSSFGGWPELAEVFAHAADRLAEGESLVGSLAAGRDRAASAELRDGLQSMIDGWNENADIVSPMRSGHSVFPEVLVDLTEAGFAAGLLEMMWSAAASFMKSWTTRNPGVAQNLKDKAFFFLMLNVLLRHGVHLEFAVEAVASDTDSPALQTAATEITKDLRQGKGFADALSTHPTLVDPETRARIQKAVLSETLRDCVGDIAGQLKRDLI